MSILVTGGAGFIGSNFVLDWLRRQDEAVVNVDKLTYAGNRDNLVSIEGDPRHRLECRDIGDAAGITRLLAHHKPRANVHFAAESHVDRSIHGPEDFIQTNSVLTASQFIATVEHRQGLKVAYPEEIACRNKRIDAAQLEQLAQPLQKNGYGKYLLRVLNEPIF